MGEHCAGVAAVLMELYGSPMNVPQAVLAHAIIHDTAEAHTGDLPATAKWASSNLEMALRHVETGYLKEVNVPQMQLTQPQWTAFKWADMFELLMYCKDEMTLGNKGIEPVWYRGVDFCREKEKALPEELRIKAGDMLHELIYQ